MYSLKRNLFSLALILVIFYVLSSSLYAQIPQNINDNTSTSFFDIQRTMDNYWKSMNVKNGFVDINGVQTKVPGWKLYKRWEYYWEQRVNHVTGQFPHTNSAIEYDKYKLGINKLSKSNSYSGNWSNLGTNSSTGGYAGIGRINCVAFHPTDPNTFWVGSPSGGIWKTTNGGSSWSILNDNQPVLGVSDIVVPSDYATSNTLYIATGDRDGGSMWSLGGGQQADNVSIGVLKSTNGGATWNTTGINYSKTLGKTVYSLLIHPTNNQIIFASTSDGIYKSTDGGANFVLKHGNRAWRLAFKPGDPTTMYAVLAFNGGPYFASSTNSGESWSFTRVQTNGYRTELCVTPADPNVVYLLVSNSGGGLFGVYKSTNSGGSFTRTDDGTKNMMGYNTDGSGANTGQCSYDIAIVASPADANTVFIAGICTWKSSDGGFNWTPVNNWTSNVAGVPVVHADKHALAYQNSTTLFEGNDGGIYKTLNGGTSWTDLTNGMITSQIYRIGVSQTNPAIVLNGLQDNGSKLLNGGFWTDVKGGDGMECIVDYNNSTYMYATYVQGQISRSTNGGISFPTNISALIPGGQPTGAWVTPYVIDPVNSSTLYAGYDRVWKTTNRGNNWDSISSVLSSDDKLRSLAVAPSNSNVLYAAGPVNLWKTTDGGVTKAWTSLPLPTTTSNVTYIAVKNNDPNTLWVTYGGYNDGSKIYESTDGGSTWTNISAGLPNLPVMCVVQYKTVLDRTVLFVGTDVGVYLKDGTNDWISFNSGLPNVVVSELEIYYGGLVDKLRAGTFGRGLWETDIQSLLPVELSAFTASFDNNSVNLKWTTKTEINCNGFQIERADSKTGNLDFSKLGFVLGHGMSNSPKNYSFCDKTIFAGNNYSYRLKQIDNDGSVSYSKIVEVQTGSIPDRYVLNQNYPNPFNPATEISYSIPSVSLVQLKIYNILGKEVSTLVNETKQPGNYHFTFNAASLPSGVYFYKLEAGSFNSIKKMVLIK